jgi:hypothetical protein
MKALTFEEIQDYCRQRSIEFESWQRSQLFFEHCSDCRVYVVGFADAASAAFEMAWTMVEPEKSNFGGALVWLSGRRADFKNADTLFARLRAGWGLTSPMDETPGYLFGPEELNDAAALMGLFMNFSWDAYWLPSHAEYMMHVNNDLLIDFAVRGSSTRWDKDRGELFRNLEIRIWAGMEKKYSKP